MGKQPYLSPSNMRENLFQGLWQSFVSLVRKSWLVLLFWKVCLDVTLVTTLITICYCKRNQLEEKPVLRLEEQTLR